MERGLSEMAEAAGDRPFYSDRPKRLPEALRSFLLSYRRPLFNSRDLFLSHYEETLQDDGKKFELALDITCWVDGVLLFEAGVKEKIAGVVNLEFILFHLYRHLELNLNPFLSHWMQIVKQWEAKFGKGRNPIAAEPMALLTMTRQAWDAMEPVGVLVEYVRMILLMEASTLEGLTPANVHEAVIKNTFLSSGLRSSVDVDKLAKILKDQGIYDSAEAMSNTKEDNHEHERTARELCGQNHKDHHFICRNMSKVLNDDGAIDKSGPPPNIRRFQGVYCPMVYLEFARLLPDIIESHPALTVDLADVFLRVDTQGNRDPLQKELLKHISRLPVSIPAMELINVLLGRRVLDDAHWMVHEYINNCLDAIDKMKGETPREPGSAGETYLAQGADESVSGEAGTGHGRATQAQAVRYLVLFLRNLVRRKIMGIENLQVYIQALRFRYIWVKDVRMAAWMDVDYAGG